ncbi:MAG: transporter substrate-binding domain-containing protein [Desulfobacula sp.]|nr:transporter substrate-binding domain-containing protein [Desulfobacula sp.]MBT4876121.1 transporter substrate-binding domain-containing protein [Desulfobacula sp.]MBT5547450.1 transporter substrate-binding domain-containing protein [Desulfobacula sp.]MBT5973912.1 transporter substrate-binding domain-containing protein [Desulfobacula sp.]MBT6751642.1 transporter substrate-binding domain-containing protein [Desulfobacula sp.]
MTIMLLAISGSFSFAASDVQKDLARSSTIEKIIRSGKLKVGMATFIPWAMQSKTGEWVGFEIDVARRLAKDMGVKIEFIPTKWEGLIPSLLTGKFDLVIAGMMGTPQRALKINFTQPYDFTGTQICIHKDYVDKIKKPSDLNDPAYTVISRVGVTAAETAKKFLPKAQKRLFSDNGSMVQELLNGKATAIIQSLPEPAQLVAKNPETLALVEGTLTIEPISMGVRKGDPDTLAYLNNWIEVVRAEGFLKERADYWWRSMEWSSLLE